MPDENSFSELIRRVRAGDQEAAADLVRRYEPFIRREIRLHLHDRQLTRVLDSMDICQSVLGSFFVRAAAGQYDLEQPGQLVRLLAAMARHKLAWQVRRQHRQRRDSRRQAKTDPRDLQLAAPGPGPEQEAEGRELLRAFQQRLSPEERQLADLRGEGCRWEDIAARLGGTPQGRRKQLARAANRVARQLGLEEDADD